MKKKCNGSAAQDRNDGMNGKNGKPKPHKSPISYSSHDLDPPSPPNSKKSHPLGPALVRETPPDSDDDELLRPRGDYHTLKSFQKAEVVYDITFRFVELFLAKGDRTRDQMVQASRSGKKNIVEGSKAAMTSKEMEIKLTNVARASLEELLDDYEDYLRTRDFPQWHKDSREALYVRRLGRHIPQTYELYREFVETRPGHVVANIALCLVNQANFLLDRQLKRLGQDFLEQGGLRERMTRLRLERRNQRPKK
jgi:four helix bundle suffix protein